MTHSRITAEEITIINDAIKNPYVAWRDNHPDQAFPVLEEDLNRLCLELERYQLNIKQRQEANEEEASPERIKHLEERISEEGENFAKVLDEFINKVLSTELDEKVDPQIEEIVRGARTAAVRIQENRKCQRNIETAKRVEQDMKEIINEGKEQSKNISASSCCYDKSLVNIATGGGAILGGIASYMYSAAILGAMGVAVSTMSVVLLVALSAFAGGVIANAITKAVTYQERTQTAAPEVSSSASKA